MCKKLVACRRCRNKKIKCSGADDVRKDGGRQQYFGACSHCTALCVACEYPGETFAPPEAPAAAAEDGACEEGFVGDARPGNSAIAAGGESPATDRVRVRRLLGPELAARSGDHASSSREAEVFAKALSSLSVLSSADSLRSWVPGGAMAFPVEYPTSHERTSSPDED